MRNNYQKALRDAEAELAAHEQRGDALRQTVEGLRIVLGAPKPAPRKAASKPAKASPKRGKGRRPVTGVPKTRKGTYRGLGPTAAYEKFKKLHGDGYGVSQVTEALLQGDVKSKSRQSVLTAIHTARRKAKLEREALNKAADAAVKKAEAAKRTPSVASPGPAIPKPPSRPAFPAGSGGDSK